MLAFSTAKVSQAGIRAADSSKITLQAQQYAASEADLLSHSPYDKLSSKAKSVISGSLYHDEVTVGKETAMPSNQDIKQKPCRVNVYYGDESIPRATLSFNRYSVSQNESSIPKGTILPWYGKSSDIPEGFALCDGTKGTPDLRNRFLVGAGSNYALGDTGGEDQVKLSGTQIGNHYHYFGASLKSSGSSKGAPSFVWLSSRSFGSELSAYPCFPSGTKNVSRFSHSSSGYIGNFGSDVSPYPFCYITSLAVSTAAQEAHENRPPYYALYYIMKLS